MLGVVVSPALIGLSSLEGQEVAQTVTQLTAGQSTSGRLERGDRQLQDDSFFDLFEYRGQPGEQITVTLRSNDFDAFLQGGPPTASDIDVQESDDDSGGGTDAQITATLGASGVYRVRANSYGADATGAYTISVESSRGTPTTKGVAAIQAGRTVQGRLDSSDRQLSDDSYFDVYEYRGSAGETIVITMRSADFDAFLQGGPPAGDDLSSADSDDDGGGGTNSQITTTVPSGGVYRIRANSLGANATGDYTLSVQSDASSPTSDVLTAGQTITGQLDTSDTQASDDSYFDVYFYEGRPGERLLITLTSSDFDTYLEWAREEASGFETVDSDDDGAGNTNSRLEVTVDRAGRYAILANSYAGGQTGRYTLSIESVGGDLGLPTISLGQTLNSRLDGSDSKRSDDTFFEIYEFRGQPGQQVMITMRSTDFDTYLQAGRIVGDNFEADASDDDSGGGTDSQVLVSVPSNGSLGILANALSAGGQGAFSITLEGLSGSGNPVAGNSTASGVPSISAGNSVSGSLDSSDPILADSSFYDQFAYAGNPGDRIRITLSSGDFDAYLGWGRLDGGSFSGEVYDDDSAGGTNAQLDVTVDGTGVFGIIANTYTAGQSGSYSLTVERLAAAPASTSSGSEGAKWMYRYVEPNDPALRSIGQRVKQQETLEEVVAALQQRYTLPRPVEISFDTCDMINAFYNPSTSQIVFCYELVDFLADIFVSDGAWTEEQRSNVFGAVQFVMMHEVGHALVDVLDLPITGREEDVADQLAVYVLLRNHEKGGQAAVAGVSALQPATTNFDETQLADEHSLGPVRLYNVLCWIYGSDPNKYGQIVASGSLPEGRAVRCPGEWDRMAKAWQRLLSGYRP